MRHFDRVDVSERRVVAEHFDVDETEDVFFHFALGDVRGVDEFF